MQTRETCVFHSPWARTARLKLKTQYYIWPEAHAIEETQQKASGAAQAEETGRDSPFLYSCPCGH